MSKDLVTKTSRPLSQIFFIHREKDGEMVTKIVLKWNINIGVFKKKKWR